jgi:hypothetical protein
MEDARKRIKQWTVIALLSGLDSRNIIAEHCSAMQFYSSEIEPTKGI